MTVIDRLTALLAGATPTDLADLDAEIARLAAMRPWLVAALASKAPAPSEEPPPGKVPAVGQPPAPPHQPKAGKRVVRTGPSAPRPGDPNAAGFAKTRRLAVARLLADRGPLRGREIAAALRIPSGSITGTLTHPWFTRTGPALRDPFQLTAAGRLALAEAGPATGPPAAIS